MMRHLDLYKDRRFSLVKLSDEKEYKLPNEYSVEEVERILELREEIEALEAEEVAPLSDASASQVKKHNDLIMAQLEVMLQHYQPKVTVDYLRKTITQNQALELVGFFQKYRHQALKEILKEKAAPADSKKKAKLDSARELRDLRRMVTFMVINGFSLLELRKLFVDELHEYYKEMIFLLEQQGTLKAGSYDKIKASTQSSDVSNTVNQLRKQMFQSIRSKRKQNG